MGDGVQVGIVQLAMAGMLFYAWWSGALGAILDAVVAGVRDPGTKRPDLSDTLGITGSVHGNPNAAATAAAPSTLPSLPTLPALEAA